MNLASELADIKPQVSTSPWDGYEHYRGYAVMMLPFSSGHLLGLRVFPENDFAPYTSVWHCPPRGDWSIYNDGPSLQTTCPRLWGPALRDAVLATIDVTWTGPDELRIEMEEPRLEWTMTMTDSRLLRIMNAVNAAMPLWTWKPRSLVRNREWLAKRLLGMGDLRLAFDAPSGQDVVFMPEQTFFIKSSRAVWEGHDLEHPVRLSENPTIGDVPLPNGPTFVIGQAHATIEQPDEYRRLRERFGAEGLTDKGN